MTDTGKNWHKKLPPTFYAYAGANTFNSNCFKVSDKVDDGIMKEALLDFYTSSGKRKPDQIIIFRDGVSESQFNQVFIKLLRLPSSLTRSGTLRIMVIVVRKTIIPSFFSKDLPTMCYMAGFSANELQEFVHSLSYMYQRSTTTIFFAALFATLIWQLHSWGQFINIRDASETSTSHVGCMLRE
ncbi:hypothetical protein CXB51_031426 [Gossypium anomalum]|uniref:Piwi domain-containing protein n=1 Tax=Gossypium anomalum TaxID=47600 RepID=A0A8J5YBD6_9ROSI|nr:hypothetical protein CXB51_031426 [Gossypium anomalum]